MTRRHPLGIVACLALAAMSLVPARADQTPGRAPAPPTAAGEWIPLFDGKSLQGWREFKKEDATGTRWAVQDGMLTLPARNPGEKPRSRDIVTTETFDRFDLTWEWRVSPGGNSGLKYFVLEDLDSAVGHEYQLIDDERHADAKIGLERQTASLYDVLSPSNRKMKPATEWNSSRIVSRGRTVEHYLNDGKVLTYELDSPELAAAIKDSKFKDVARFGKLQQGHILLQDHQDQVWFRNIRIRRLADSTE